MRRKLTAAEQIASCFQCCDCGKPDDHRHRLIMFWQQDASNLFHSAYYPVSCCEDDVRASVKELPAAKRPTILVRVKPSPELIALADKIGASVQ